MTTAIEMKKAIQEFLKNLPPLSEEDIALVENNKSLSVIQKILIKRRLRRIINEQNK